MKINRGAGLPCTRSFALAVALAVQLPNQVLLNFMTRFCRRFNKVI
jgi:hypothetical protein